MTSVLDKELSGDPISIAIRGSAYELAYPMHNVILYKQKTGDSLFDPASWPKIDLTNDPERWLACLWSGMHQQQTDKSWKAPFTIEELGALIDFSNAGTISVEMVRALTQFMPKKKPDGPKTTGLDESAQTPPTSPTSIDSGRELVGATASPATNS